jgi:hypothetical protein
LRELHELSKAPILLSSIYASAANPILRVAKFASSEAVAVAKKVAVACNFT